MHFSRKGKGLSVFLSLDVGLVAEGCGPAEVSSTLPPEAGGLCALFQPVRSVSACVGPVLRPHLPGLRWKYFGCLHICFVGSFKKCTVA